MAEEIIKEEHPAEKYAAWIVQNADKKGTPEFNTVAAAYQDALKLGAEPKASVEVSSPEGNPVLVNSQMAETGGGAVTGRPVQNAQLNILPKPRPLESALAGATKSFIDPAVAMAQMLTQGKHGTSDLAKRLGEEADVYYQENPVAYGTGRIAGAIAPAAATTKAIGMIPSFAKLSPYVQGAGYGAVAGALSPEETGKTGQELLGQELKQVGGGAILGAPSPLIGKAADVVYHAGKSLVEPFYKMGRNEIIGRALRQFAGGDAEKAIENLRSYENLVPGSAPTVGEVAGVPSLAAAQRAVANASPEATNALAGRQLENTQARTNALESIATPTRVAKYQDLRSRVSDELYSDALKPLNLGELTPEMTTEIKGLIKTPAIKRAMGQAQENAANRGIDITDPAGSMRGLHETKMALDDEIARVKALAEKNGGSSSAELNSLQTAKSRLLNFMENVSPEYKVARQNYERLSKPVEQLEAISNLANKSTSNKDSAIYLNRFSNELEKAKNEGILSPRQIQRLEAIKEDLLRTDYLNNSGRGVGSDTVQKLAYNNMLNQLNLPNLLRRRGFAETIGNIAARASDVAYGGANKQLTNELAQTLLDPRKAAAMMKLAGKEGQASHLTPEQANIARLLLIKGAENLPQENK